MHRETGRDRSEEVGQTERKPGVDPASSDFMVHPTTGTHTSDVNPLDGMVTTLAKRQVQSLLDYTGLQRMRLHSRQATRWPISPSLYNENEIYGVGMRPDRIRPLVFT